MPLGMHLGPFDAYTSGKYAKKSYRVQQGADFQGLVNQLQDRQLTKALEALPQDERDKAASWKPSKASLPDNPAA